MFNILIYGKDHKRLGIPAIFDYNFDMDVQFEPIWNERVGESTLFKFKTLKKIPPNTKYIIYISYYGHILDNNNDTIFEFHKNAIGNKISHYPMPDRIKEDSNNGLVHWIIDYSTECTLLDYNSSRIDFKKLCSALYTIPKNITLITGAETALPFGTPTLNAVNELGYNVVTGYRLFEFLGLSYQISENNIYTDEKIKDILNCKILQYKSLCYNRLPRHHRTVIVAHIIKNNYSENCLYSLGKYSNRQRDSWIDEFPELNQELKILHKGPIIYPHIKEESVDLKNNQADKLGWDHGLNSYFQLVTETTPDYARYPFITEKSLKPFAMMQPFIQYGPKNNVKNLKRYGFEIFDKWIDHSYDDEEDDINRLRMVLKEFDKLQNIPAEKWSNMLLEMIEPLLHNLQLVKKRPIFSTSTQLIPILTNFMKNDANS